MKTPHLVVYPPMIRDVGLKRDWQKRYLPTSS